MPKQTTKLVMVTAQAERNEYAELTRLLQKPQLDGGPTHASAVIGISELNDCNQPKAASESSQQVQKSK